MEVVVPKKARKHNEMSARSLLVLIGGTMLALVAATAILARPPIGGIYRIQETVVGTQQETVGLLDGRGCLTITQSQSDVGKKRVSGSYANLYTIIVGSNIDIVDRNGNISIRDKNNGLEAEAGDAFTGEVLFPPPVTGFDRLTLSADLGWPFTASCGSRIAIVHSIKRVQRKPSS